MPVNYHALNRGLLEVAPKPRTRPLPGKPADFRAAASTSELDRAVKIVPLPEAIPEDLSAAAIAGMERLRALGHLSALRGARATDLPRPEAGRLASLVRAEAPALFELVERVEGALGRGPLFVRALKLDIARASTTATSEDPGAFNLHFDAEKSSLAEYPDPVFQFYLNAGRLERQFRIFPIERGTMLAELPESERATVTLEALLDRYLDGKTALLETIPVESGCLAVFDGRRFAHDAGKSDIAALLGGRFEPAAEPDLVLTLDTVETGYHRGLYRPELPFFEDRAV